MAGKIVTFYNVTVLSGELRWTLSKRYNDFLELHNALQNRYADLPDFPAKTYLKAKGTSLESRRAALEVYVKVSSYDGRVSRHDKKSLLMRGSEPS